MQATKTFVFVVACALAWAPAGVLAAAGSPFTFQGQLKVDGVPADGSFDFVFRLFDAAMVPTQIGTDQPIDDWPVSNGLFTVELNGNNEFGSDAFNGAARRLEVAVRAGASVGPHSVLTPRVALNPTPYAEYALHSADGGLWSANGSDIYNTNSGNVGIGTTGPDFKLDVSGEVRINSMAGLRFPADPFGGSGDLARIFLEQDASGTERISLVIQNDNDGPGTSEDNIRLRAANVFVEPNSGADSGEIGGNLLVTTGNVGIGTPIPGEKLTVVGTIESTSGGFKFPDGTVQATAAGAGIWGTNGDSIYYNGGRVGVGTSSPAYNLHVHGDGWGGVSPAKLGIQKFVGVLPPGTSFNDWFSIEVGGVGGFGEYTPGTRLVRESGTMLVFQTEDTMNSVINLRTTQMVLDADGNLGLGSNVTPIAKLEVVSSSGQNAVSASSGSVGVYGLHDGAGTFPGVWGESNSTSGGATALRGIITSTSPGSSSAGVLGLNKGTGGSGIGVWGRQDGSGHGVYGFTPDGRGVYGNSTNGVGVYGYSANGYAGFFDGTVSVDVLEIAGADLAEKFPVSEEVKPGMVVAIDPEHPGKLCLARGAYNRRVAGVVSGANGLPAGAVLGHLAGNEDAPAVALSGRVWVYCDATEQPLEPGDLLTTSATPGHAMKVVDYPRAQGAIIGKAMTALPEGRGMVLVLVSLQ